jgi:hypothetical protein
VLWLGFNENLVDIGEAIGILAGQSIGEPNAINNAYFPYRRYFYIGSYTTDY